MKTTFFLLLLAASSALAQTLNLDKAPLLDAPGPGYRREPHFTEKPAILAAPLPRPAMSMLQATTIADREMQARGFAEDFILRSITFVRAPQVGDSYYVAIVSPLDPSINSKHREFRIDMRGTATFREGDGSRSGTKP